MSSGCVRGGQRCGRWTERCPTAGRGRLVGKLQVRRDAQVTTAEIQLARVAGIELQLRQEAVCVRQRCIRKADVSVVGRTHGVPVEAVWEGARQPVQLPFDVEPCHCWDHCRAKRKGKPVRLGCSPDNDGTATEGPGGGAAAHQQRLHYQITARATVLCYGWYCVRANVRVSSRSSTVRCPEYSAVSWPSPAVQSVFPNTYKRLQRQPSLCNVLQVDKSSLPL